VSDRALGAVGPLGQRGVQEAEEDVVAVVAEVRGSSYDPAAVLVDPAVDTAQVMILAYRVSVLQ
jgi:hypothetical protein